MRVRSSAESVDRYLRNSIRAFLDGEQNLKWIAGVISHSGAVEGRAQQLFEQLDNWGISERRDALRHILSGTVRDASRVDRS
jgi:hypothetical protein